MAITIKTHLNEGIYKSQGGGQTTTHYVYTTGPLNLMKAVRQLKEHHEGMVRGYGNIGCGRSWLEINDQEYHIWELGGMSLNKARRLIAEAEAANISIEEETK